MSIAAKGLICPGIDPGLARVGYGVVLQTGSRVQALLTDVLRQALKRLSPSGLRRYITLWGSRLLSCSPDFVSVERLFFGRNTYDC